jgi:hypothetical protein
MGMKRNVLLAVMLAGGALLAPVWVGGAQAQPEPTMVISPSSGPCDDTVEVTGRDFPPSTSVWLAISEPGTQSNLGDLTSVVADSEGRFSVTVALGFLGCAAAEVYERVTGSNQIAFRAYVQEGTDSGEGIRRNLAHAPYTFTTTESTIPLSILTLSPSSGPCDATVEVRGQLFEPNSEIAIEIARPYSEGFLGTVGNIGADANGDFLASLPLGELGCEAAALEAQADPRGQRAELSICGAAYRRSYCATYSYTTTEVALEGPIIALPISGHGPQHGDRDGLWVALVLGLAGGTILIAARLVTRRGKTS